MTLQDQERARVATEQIYTLGFGIIGVSSPTYDQRATTRALINQESHAALIDTLEEQGNAYKPDRYDAILATRLETLQAQLENIASGANPPTTPQEATADAPTTEESPAPEISAPVVPNANPGKHPGPPPPPPGQWPNPYTDKFPLATPPSAQVLPG